MQPLERDDVGDRACLALARSRALSALTTDRTWRDIDIDVEVEVIRPD
jgi:PIN domain nuclease of toxin-antitoxin system